MHILKFKLFFRTGYLFSMIFLGNLLLLSCTKEHGVKHTGEGKIVFSVKGAQELTSVFPMTKSGMNRPTGASFLNQNKHTTSTKIGEYDLNIVSEKKQLSLDIPRSSELDKHSLKTRSSFANSGSITAMDNDVKYRILLVNKKSNTVEKSVLATAGVPMEIDVVKGHDYNWFAYSYNSIDDIASPDMNNPTVNSKIDMPLLYAKGAVSTSQIGSIPISIQFEHQLTQLEITIDTRGLFGSPEKTEATFVEEYIKTGNFDIKTGSFTGNLSGVDVGDLRFINKDIHTNYLKSTHYYTADIALQSYAIQFEELTIKLINEKTESLSAQFPDGGLVEFANFQGSSKGKILAGQLEMWKVFPVKSILHVEGNSNFSYAASNPDKASGAFLRNKHNFGLKSNYFRSQGFYHEILKPSKNTLKNRLSNPAYYPDVIIAGMFTGFEKGDFDALYKYIQRGGVVFLMIENSNSPHVQDFMKQIFGPTVSIGEHDSAGAVYLMTNEDANILNWRFGDVRGKHWGQDASQTLYVKGIPEDQVVKYSSFSSTGQQQSGLSMFRHKTKHFFYVGDTGFLSNEWKQGEYPSTSIEPFATSTDGNDFPVPKSRYGRTAEQGSIDYPKKEGSYAVYNSIIFANAFAYLVATSHYMGIDKNP